MTLLDRIGEIIAAIVIVCLLPLAYGWLPYILRGL